MNYTVEWSKAATKELLAIEKKQRLIIVKWVEENLEGCENPRAVKNGKHLEGTENGWRWHVGKYRILAKLDDDKLIIEVVRAGHRSHVYRNLPKM